MARLSSTNPNFKKNIKGKASALSLGFEASGFRVLAIGLKNHSFISNLTSYDPWVLHIRRGPETQTYCLEFGALEKQTQIFLIFQG